MIAQPQATFGLALTIGDPTSIPLWTFAAHRVSEVGLPSRPTAPPVRPATSAGPGALRPSHQRVLAALQTIAVHGRAQVSSRQLAALLGLARGALLRIVRRLQGAGALQVHRPQSPAGAHEPAVYCLDSAATPAASGLDSAATPAASGLDSAATPAASGLDSAATPAATPHACAPTPTPTRALPPPHPEPHTSPAAAAAMMDRFAGAPAREAAAPPPPDVLAGFVTALASGPRFRVEGELAALIARKYGGRIDLEIEGAKIREYARDHPDWRLTGARLLAWLDKEVAAVDARRSPDAGPGGASPGPGAAPSYTGPQRPIPPYLYDEMTPEQWAASIAASKQFRPHITVAVPPDPLRTAGAPG